MSLTDVLLERGVPDTSDLEALIKFGDDLYGRLDHTEFDGSSQIRWEE